MNHNCLPLVTPIMFYRAEELTGQIVLKTTLRLVIG